MGLKPSAMPTTGSGWRRATLGICPSLAAREGRRLEASMRLHPTRRAPPAEVSRVRGRPAFAARRLSSDSPHVRDARGAGVLRSCETQDPRRELRPNPIRSDTSCRAIVVHQVESLMPCGRRPRRAGAVRLRRSRRANPALTCERESGGLTWPRRAPAFAGCMHRGPRAASPGPPRRGTRSAAPEVPSIVEPPGEGIPGFRPASPAR